MLIDLTVYFNWRRFLPDGAIGDGCFWFQIFGVMVFVHPHRSHV